MMENKDASQAEIDAVTKKLSEALRQRSERPLQGCQGQIRQA